jgi:hypothetical protein
MDGLQNFFINRRKVMFKVNEGWLDRVIRLVLGVVLIIIGLYLSGALKIVLIILGIIGIITGLTGFCGLYALFGINTCGLPKKKG